MFGSQERPGNVLIALVAITIFLSVSSASILVLLSHATSYACAFWRMLFSTVIVSTFLAYSKGSLEYLKDPKILAVTFISGIALGLHFLLWMRSLFLVPVAISVTIVSTYPFFNLVTDLLIFKEKVTVRQFMYLSLGFLFLTLFMNPKMSHANLYGSLLALGGAIAASVYFSAGRRLRKSLSLGEYVTPVYMIATLTIFLYSAITHKNLIHYSLRSYVFFLLLAVIPMMGGHTLMNYLLKFMKSSVVTSIALGEPIGAAVLAYIFLDQRIGLKQIVLMLLVVLCLVGIVYEENRLFNK